jgi:TRAP-type uncharacterized transport system substrate-binding protein
MSRAESDAVLKRLLDFLQRDRRIRIALGVIIVGALVAYAARSAYNLYPRSYRLTITGGDILTNRHYLAKVLQNEARKKGITLTVQPVRGTLPALEQVAEGKLDLAFIQGGLEATQPNIEHVATVLPELVHLLVKPGIKGLGNLEGRSVNMGVKPSAMRDIFLMLTHFSGYKENVDFVETNYSPEQLLALPAHKMPDAILTVSSVPSYLVELLVERHGYQVAEIPIPESLALRFGWASNGQILAYTYDLTPPVPEKNIVTVAVNMHLVANPKVDPLAISKLLEVLYSPAVANVLRQPIDEKRIAVPSGYPLSAGLTTYLTRNDSLFTTENWNKLSNLFGLVMSFGGMSLVVTKWFRGAEPKPETHDKEFHGYLAAVAGFEKEMAAIEAMDAPGPAEQARARAVRDGLHALRISILERLPKVSLKDPLLFDRTVQSARSAHAHARELCARGGPPPNPIPDAGPAQTPGGAA